MPKIDSAPLLEHIRQLSSDEFEGRAPGTPGEERTVQYLTAEFQKLGLKPGNTDGTYIQKVPLVGITGVQAKPLVVSGKARATFKWRDEVVAWTKHVADGASIDNSDLVFVGYGVVAPEYNWDDFKGVDLKGKTMVVLVNDPQVPDPADPTKLDARTFNGTAMTYYGRWTYKFEEAARRGAAGALIVHETGPAGYPFAVVQGNLNEKFDLVTPDKNMGRANIEGWLSLDAARRLLKMAGQDFDTLKKQATTREFKPVPLGLKASLAVKNTLRTIDSRNVLAKLEGSDPQLKDEYVVYTAHWDHFGIGVPVERRQDLQRRARQRVGCLVDARDGTGADASEAGAEAIDPVRGGDRGGAGAARLAGTTPSHPSTRSRRRSPTSTSTASISGAARKTLRSSGLAPQTSTTICATRPPSRAGRSGPIRKRKRASTIDPTTSTSRSRGCRRSTPTTASSSSASRPSTPSRSATNTRSATITSRPTRSNLTGISPELSRMPS